MMSDKINFILTLKKLICSLKKYKNNHDIDNIKNFFINNTERLKENDLLITIINKLIFLSEKDVSVEEADDFVENISQYWFNLINESKFHIVFYGDNENFLILTQLVNLKDKIIDIDYVDMDKLYTPIFSKDIYPVAIYDDKGSSILKTKEKNTYLDYIYIPFNSFSNKSMPINLDFSKYLDYEFKKIKSKSIKNIVTGSSHAWFAFPDSLTTITSNMSMHCADLTYASSIINQLETHSANYSYLHIVSPFDLFNELSLRKRLFPKQVFNSIRAFCHNNNIPYNYSTSSNKNSVTLSDSITSSINLTSPISITSPISDILTNILINTKEIDINIDFNFNFNTLNKSISSVFLPEEIIKSQNRTDYQQKDMADNNSIVAGQYHSAMYKRKNSFDVNAENITAIIKSIKKQKAKIHFIIPPYPKLYMSNINKDMLSETIIFYKSIADNETIYFSDYSNESDFIQSDFLDGDHLNLNGAKKFISKLSERGIII